MFCRMSVFYLAIALCVGSASLASAQNSGDPESRMTASPCDEETGARVAFLTERLEGDRKWARSWTVGFRSFYGLGTVVTAAQAIDEDDSGDRAVDIVSSVKAAFGTARLFWSPPNARLGASAMYEVLLDSADSCQRRLDNVIGHPLRCIFLEGTDQFPVAVNVDVLQAATHAALSSFTDIESRK